MKRAKPNASDLEAQGFPVLVELPNLLSQTSLDGTQGSNRETHRPCQIRAKNDFEALHCWLDEYRQNLTTHRLYQKEAERLFLWSLYQQQKSFSSLDTEDFRAYFNFLNNPQPKSVWCATKGGRGQKRGEQGWRPFVGPLSTSTKATTITILHSFITYLVDAQYLAYDPIKLIRKKNNTPLDLTRQKLNLQQRILAPDEWHALLETLENMSDATPHLQDEKERLKFSVYIFYFLGLRVNELVTHTWGAFRKEQDGWWFYVLGKGNKLGKIPANAEFMVLVKQYRKHLRFPEDPEPTEEFPLIASWRTGHAVSARFINQMLKRLALEAAKRFEGEPEKVEKLKKFSAHWLRHLSASMQDSAGIQFKHIRENLRHQNDDTTRLYVHALDKERHEDMNKLTLKIPGPKLADEGFHDAKA